MIFRHGFFHGDPHPANILVLEEAGTIGLVDFGAVGKLSDDDMTKLTRLFIDAAAENIDVLPKRLADLGVRYPKEREQEFLAELREIYYRYYGASLAEIDPIQIVREAFQLIYTMNLQLPTRFLLLDRAIATLGSVGDRALSGLQRVRGRAAVRARADARAVHARAGRAPRAPRRDALRADPARGAVPVARPHGAGARRADRGRLRAQGPRRLPREHAARLQPARRRARSSPAA